MKKKVSVIGIGYVGFPLVCALAETNKYDVVGFDISNEKVEKAKNHIPPVEDEYCNRVINSIEYTVDSNPEVLKNTDIFLICVPTPIDEKYDPDYTPVIKATELISKYLKKGAYVVLESTVNPGTCEEVVQPIIEKETGMKAGMDFELAHCPERINPGDPKWYVKNIPRNVGAKTEKGTKFLADFYRSILEEGTIVNEMGSIKEAEATKIIENTFRDINIAYVNELAKSFDLLGIDLINVIKGASNKPFAFMTHYPGCGVGGHCIPVDPYYLIQRAKLQGFDHRFLRNARTVNNSMPQYTVERLVMALNSVGKAIKGSKVALLGLSYKENISDLRESPALIIRDILTKQYESDLRVYEPYNLDLSTHKSLEEVLSGVDAVVIATGHKVFREYPIEKWAKVPVIIDGRNCLNKDELIKSGVVYKGIGR